MRTLRKDEIECKVAMVKEKGLQLLLYKTARTDMEILDEVYGPLNWKCSYQEIKGNLYCTISIWDKEKAQWIDKQDCGVESAFGDKEKGEASDSFKRAGFKVGIGRELYNSPFIWVGSDKANITTETDKNNKKNSKCMDKFFVEEIDYNNGEITKLVIFNDTKKCVAYQYGSYETKEPKKEKLATDTQIKEAIDLGVNIEKVVKFYNKDNMKELTFEELQKSINAKKKQLESQAVVEEMLKR